MKKTLLLFSLFISTFVSAQTIPNAGFETWVTDTLSRLDPTDWGCSNLSTSATSVFQDVGRTGTGYSVKMTVVPSGGVIPIGGSINMYSQPFSGATRPAALRGYWKCNNTNGDFITVHIYTYNSSGSILADKAITTNLFSSSGWTAFFAPLAYTSADAIASYTITISLFAHGSASGASTGNVDDLQFDYNTGIEETSPNFTDCFLTNQGSAYNLNFTNNSMSKIRLNVLDITGREVLLIADQKFSVGEQSIPFDISNLAHGVYSCIITDGSQKSVVRMRVE